MNVLESTRRYEKWLAAETSVIKADLRYKHEQMAASLFNFMRATFYRWVELWKEHCADLNGTPKVLGIGDLHVENFGTWRDVEGRLIWGVNDFDESCRVPYANDLVRLATSADLAIREDQLSIGRREAAEMILEGYIEGLRTGGRPYVLDEEHVFLRDIAYAELRDPEHFWKKMRELPDFKGSVSSEQRRALELLLPEKGLRYDIKTRRAGLGSLGRVRLVAIAEWRGSLVAREIKALIPSAWSGANNGYAEIIRKAIRVPDPFVRKYENWVVRRLAPHCSRIDLASLPKKRDEARFLNAMGRETANIHLATPESIDKIRHDVERRPAKWLQDAAEIMGEALKTDWKAFAS